VKTVLLAAIAALACSGCMTATYTAPDNGGKLTLTKFCWETKIGRLEATDGQRKIVVENYDSTSQAIQLAETAVKALGAVK
jgi:ribosomal protein L33